MLVLGRKEQQSLFIDGKIKVTVLEIKHSIVKLGIEAPREIAVVRDDANVTEPAHRNQIA